MTTRVPPHLAPYVAILGELRPVVVADDERDAVMAAVYDEFSERNLAEVLAAAFGEDPHAMLARAIEAHRRLGGSAAALQMRRLLIKQGWDFYDGDGHAVR